MTSADTSGSKKVTDSEVNLIGILVIKDGTEKDFLQAASAVVSSTHKEDGCIAYSIHQDESNPLRFIFIEKYQSAASLEAHMTSSHFKVFFAVVKDLLAAKPVVYKTGGPCVQP